MEKMIKPGNVVEFIVTRENSDDKQTIYSYVCKENEKGADADSKGFRSHITYEEYINKYKGTTTDTSIFEQDKCFKVNRIFGSAYEAQDYLLKQENNSVDVDSVVDINQGGYNYSCYIVEPNTDVKIKDGLTVINTNAPIYNYLKGKTWGEVENPLVVLDNNIPVYINNVYKDIEEYNNMKELKTEYENEKKAKKGSVVDATIDGSSFMFYLSDDKNMENADKFTMVYEGTPLYKSLKGHTDGDKFAYVFKDKDLGNDHYYEGHINKVYPSLENYDLCLTEIELDKLHKEINELMS